MSLEAVFNHVDAHSQDSIQELVRLVKQPSVSATGEGIHRCAEMVEESLRQSGFSTMMIPEKDGNPVVYGEMRSIESKKTLLFYDHYDVQPPEPLDEWKFDAYSGEVSKGRIYGRGTSDNKGNIVTRIKAVESILTVAGALPVTVKFVVEGEEEIGSPHLGEVVRSHKDLLSSDAAIWEFGGTNREGRPEIYLGLKGVLSVELRAKGAVRDVHSANAPLVPSPAWRLAWALNTLKGKDEMVLIDGFYDDVRDPSEEELKLLDEIPLEEEELKKSLGLKTFLHDRTGEGAKRALLLQPTCTINGFLAGYTGPGSKTVLPKEAMAKLDFRLVYNQMPDDIFAKLVGQLRASGFGDIEAIRYGSTEPTKTPPEDPFVNLVAQAAEKVYRKRCVVYPTSAGSGPMHLFRNWLGYPVVSAGCSHAEAWGHAPNENLTVEGFIQGIKFMAAILHDFGQSST